MPHHCPRSLVYDKNGVEGIGWFLPPPYSPHTPWHGNFTLQMARVETRRPRHLTFSLLAHQGPPKLREPFSCSKQVRRTQECPA